LPRYRVSIDIGGTFTDLLALDEETGTLTNIKIPSTPRQPSEAVITALREFLQGARTEEIASVTHATTIAVNSLLGQLGLELPKTALITTKGFRDVIEIGRQKRPELYNLSFRKPRTLIARMHRYEVRERITASGKEIEPLDEEDAARIGETLKAEDVKSVAIGFINSYIQPSHELKIERQLREACPDLHITLSHRVAREYREYERISTAAVNACLMPIISDYVAELSKRLKEELKIESTFTIMQSNGGIASNEVITEKPVTIIESGPAAGVMSTSFYSKLLNLRNMISFDMGGTTAKAGIVKDGLPEVTSEYEVGGKVHSGRIIRGSGYPIRFPFIDVVECGAGGGTIAWVDDGGGVRLGPMSAGAEPGPACYGKGGEKPTITDANVVLGRLNPKYLLGGRLRIYANLAEKSVRKEICEKTGLDLIEAAAGTIKIAVSEINKIVRIVSVERGVDPRNFTLIAFGGAGPMHACLLAHELCISQIIVPLNPGLFSALGLITADYVHHDSRPIFKVASEINADEIEMLFAEMETETRDLLLREQVNDGQIAFERQLDMRYRGQAYELSVRAMKPFNKGSLKEVVKRFHEKHQGTYGYYSEDEVEAVNAKVTARGITVKPIFQKNRQGGRKNPQEAKTSMRSVHFNEGNSNKCPIYNRDKLCSGDTLDGPAVVEQYDSTTLVFPDWTCNVDEYHNLRLKCQK
jgi:N-methylhydantoinase A